MSMLARRALRDAVGDLAADGFAVVKDVFTHDELDEAKSLLDGLFAQFGLLSHGPSHGSGRGGRTFAWDMADTGTSSAPRQAADQPEILYPSALEPALRESAMFRKTRELAQHMLGSSTYAFDHAIYKPPRNETATEWHQDVSFTPFRFMPKAIQPRRVHFWIPFQDVDDRNGCMEFMRMSHKGPLFRHEAVTRERGEQGLRTVVDQTYERVACPLTAGGLTIHDPYTLHYAGRNRSDHTRAAWIIHFSRAGRAETIVKRCFGRMPAGRATEAV